MTALEDARAEYAELQGKALKLDLTRGKPSAAQLDLSDALLGLPSTTKAADGTDTRNYGGLHGLPELREIFSGPLQVPTAQLLALGNSSLTLMHDVLVGALLSPVPGGDRPWFEQADRAFLCPVPGYDRHFALAQHLGFDLLPVPMTPDGPDTAEVERLAADPRVKGMWSVPRYSNPDGTTYAADVVERLVSLPTAAPDFRIMWDDAYAVHHLTDDPAPLAPALELAEKHGNPDRVFVFGSTSKVTYAGAGVAFFGSSTANVDWLLGRLTKSTIGPDKVNHLRHAEFLGDAEGLAAHMRKQAELVRPKFEAVDRILTERLGDTGFATWTSPTGGYFSLLQVKEGTASRVVALAKDAGIALTPAGATHPYGVDPTDSMIRIAPTFPALQEVEQVVEGLATCVKLAALEAE